MKTKDLQVVKDARSAAEKELSFYREMMAHKVHDQMLNLYLIFDPKHTCNLCKLKI